MPIRILFTAILTACSLLAGAAEPVPPALSTMLSSPWVPENPHQLDFKALPKVLSEHVVISNVRAQGADPTKLNKKAGGVNQHNYLAHHDGRFWAMWSDGPGIEDQVGQRVKYATSTDGLKWSQPQFMTPIPPNSGPDSPHYGTRTDKGMRWISRGFWKREGELLALASLDEAAGFFGKSLELRAFRFDTATSEWWDAGLVFKNTINNFPPIKLRTGDWMMSRRMFDYSKSGVHFLVGGVKSLDDWQSFPVLGSASELKAEEPDWWILPDHRLAAVFRDNRRSGFLYRSLSTDDGRTWTTPVKTNFPDATSKISGLRLQDGRYVLVSNPNPKKRDPLTLSISDDGLVFKKMLYLVGGRHIDYPHVIEHGDSLFIAFAGGKQTVEVLKVKLSDVDAVKMPEKPVTEVRPTSKPISKSKEDAASVPRMSLADGIVRGGSFDQKAQRMPKGDIAVGLQEVASGFAVPLVLTFAPGQKDRLYIADQIGIIRIVDHSRLRSEPFLDLRPWLKELTPAYDERGLLGLAFHPQFDRKDHPGFRKLYTFTSEPPGPCEVPQANAADKADHLNVVTEWRASDDDTSRVDVGSRRVVFSYATPNFHHNGGSLAFGRDGLLYISVGDGGTGAVFAPGKPPVGIAQDNESPRGKILRIDPLGLQGIKTGTGQYSAPSDNPYANRPGLDAIYALGFRNPWRMSFDRATGSLVVGDVGQTLREEVNIVKRGGNYGWPFKEGEFYFNGNLATLTRDVPWADEVQLVDPALSYTREYIQSGVLSVVGGYVYRGAAIPQLRGRYVFANWTTSGGLHGQLFHADLRSGEMKQFLIGPSDEPLDGYLAAFGEDAEGELYALTTSLAGPKGTTGKIRRLVTFHGEVKPRVTPISTEETSPRLAETPIARGKRLFTEKLCATCHQTDPTVPAPPGEALHAPRFLGKFWGQPLQVHDGIGGPLVGVDFNEAYFVESVKEPMKKIHEGSTPGMVVVPMTDDEIKALMAYVKSLSK